MILIYAALIFSAMIEIPKFIKKKAWKELALFSAFWLPGMGISILRSLHVKLPFIADVISRVIIKMFPFVDSI